MKKGVVNFFLIAIAVVVLGVILFFAYNGVTGKVVSSGEHTIGPGASEQACMMSCMGCSSPGVGCTGNQATCLQQCNVVKPEQSEDEKCVEACVLEGCGQYDFTCQGKNQAKCDKQCGMIKEPEAKSEEEQCIRDCINLNAPGTICGASAQGETGGSVCQMCASQCVHLYSGPCLNDEQIKEKQKECGTCEHCYGEPAMGDSGEGWGDCIVDVECKDASSEFGDEPGSGPGIGQEGFVAKVGETISETVGSVFEGISNFFGNLFGGSDNLDKSGE